MPNHVSNILIAPHHVMNAIHGGTRMEVRKSRDDEVISETQYEIPVDFNSIFPMPEVLEGTVSPPNSNDVLAYFQNITLDRLKSDFEKYGIAFKGGAAKQAKDLLFKSSTLEKVSTEERLFSGDPVLLGEKAFFGKISTGWADWYSWRNEHWGTKWGAYSFNDSRNFKSGDYAGVYFETAWSTPFKLMTKLSKKFPNDCITVMYADEDHGYNLGIYCLKDGLVVFMWHPDKGSKEAMKFAALIKDGVFECGDPEIDQLVREQFLGLNENFEYDEAIEDKYEWVRTTDFYTDKEWEKIGKVKGAK